MWSDYAQLLPLLYLPVILYAAHLLAGPHWQPVVDVTRSTITIVLSTLLIWIYRRQRSVPARLSRTVGWMLLFVVDWRAYLRDARGIVTTTSPTAVAGFVAVLTALTALVARATSEA